MQESQSNYWLDVAVRDITTRYPEGELVVSSGISPSASYHIGHFREIMTAEALAWGLRRAGREARHLHIVDNFDPLRKWYDFLPPAPRDYAGWPVALVPDPLGDCHASYADHFYSEFEASLEPMGIKNPHLTILKSYEDLYKTGRLAPYIAKAIDHGQFVREVLAQVSHRELPEDWLPVSYVGAESRFVKATLGDWDAQALTIAGHALDSGIVKLDWRLDWPARWAALGVNVEPFGAQEHGAAGGSYETGAEFAREVYGVEPPYAGVQYGHIHRPGENIKMSSSKGNGVTPAQALAIMPPELLRYFIVRSRPENKLYFDPGLGLYNLIDEFAAAQADPNHEFRDAYLFAVDGQEREVIADVPFSHLVATYQAARGEVERILELLSRTGYEEQVKKQREVIELELVFVANWLDRYAPESVKFSVQEELPDAELSEEQRAFLTGLADRLEAARELDGQGMHEAIYAAKDAAQLKPQQAFQTLYRMLLNKDSGPKAGWFLASLDRDWLISRLRLTK